MPWFVVLALFIASFALSAILAPGPQDPASLEDFEFPQSDEGTPHAIAFGDVWTSGWFIPFWGNLRTVKIKQKKK